MSFVSLQEAKKICWMDIPQCAEYQRHADSLPPLDRLEVLKKVASLRSRFFCETTKPLFFSNPSISLLEKAVDTLSNLDKALEQKNLASVKREFSLLPDNLQKALMWAVWFHDVLEARPMLGPNHGEVVIMKNPLVLSSYFLPILHLSGGSLAKQLYHYEYEYLLLKYQEAKCRGVFATKNDNIRLRAMELSIYLSQYEQYKVIDSVIKNPEQRAAISSRLSPQVLEWIAAAKPKLRPRPVNYLYDQMGAQYYDGSTFFSLLAPSAKHVQCILKDTSQRILEMERSSEGIWSCASSDAPPGTPYVYRIQTQKGDVFEKIDPFSFSICLRDRGKDLLTTVVDRLSFDWADGAWCDARAKKDPLQHPLSIYELHIKSWDNDKEMNLRSLAPKIVSYCKEMGFTHVELYGIMEHFWPRAVSYQVTNYFSPHHECGSYNDMKYFVNYLHTNEIGVIIDWIPCHFDHGSSRERAHFASSIHYLDGTDMYAEDHSKWGTLYFDLSKPAAFQMLFASALWWINEFHVDGLRVDAVSQIINRKGTEIKAGVEFLRSLNENVHEKCPGVLMIAEATDWDTRMCRPTTSGGIGFDLNWSCGASGDIRNYLKTSVSDRGKKQHHHGKLEKVFFEGQRVHEKKIFTHSHDDSDGRESHHKTLFNIADGRSLNEAAKFSDVRNFFAYQIFSPGWGHMIHMGDELAQKEAWSARFKLGRSSVDWDSISHAGHRGIQRFVKDSIVYYKSREDFWKRGGGDSELFYSYAPNNVIAYTRGANQVVIHNFSDKDFPSYHIDVPCRLKGAQFEERLNSSHEKYGGSGHYINRDLFALKAKGDNNRTICVSLASRVSIILEKI